MHNILFLFRKEMSRCPHRSPQTKKSRKQDVFQDLEVHAEGMEILLSFGALYTKVNL